MGKMNLKKLILISIFLITSLSACQSSSQTSKEIVEVVSLEIQKYYKKNKKYPDSLMDIENFPYEIKCRRCGWDYNIRNLDGSFINNKHYLILVAGNKLLTKRVKFDYLIALSHDDIFYRHHFIKGKVVKELSTPRSSFRQ